jgi:molecular chaperone GrpE
MDKKTDNGEATEEEFQIKDRRHWQQSEEISEEISEEKEEEEIKEAEPTDEAEPAPARPTIIDEYRERAELAETKLHEYIDAYKKSQADHEQFRLRLNRDIERKVEQKFGDLITGMLESVDDLERALEHTRNVPEAEPLVHGIELALANFQSVLEANGVESIAPDGEAFDPNDAEAIRVDPVDSAEGDGLVTATLRKGYRLGDCLIRPARVAVGRHVS